MSANKIGTITWQDLTVKNAEEVRDFYAGVVGWQPHNEDMGDYSDYNMIPPGGSTSAAGICHAAGVNADIPPQWLIYISVESVERSAAKCIELGGKIVVAPRPMGYDLFCVIQDPAGAICAIYEKGAARDQGT
jgi:predicted enzyme related to lactoylglutathione lyase